MSRYCHSHSRIHPFWAAALAVVMGSLFLVSAGSFLAALRHPSPVVDTDYYSHGLHYGRDGKEAPWRLEAATTREAVEIRVVDPAGAPVTRGQLVCRLNGRADHAVTFSESRPGTYAAPRTLLPKGDLHATVVFSRGGFQSTRRMVIIQ